jgi:hypothetical protein
MILSDRLLNFFLRVTPQMLCVVHACGVEDQVSTTNTQPVNSMCADACVNSRHVMERYTTLTYIVHETKPSDRETCNLQEFVNNLEVYGGLIYRFVTLPSATTLRSLDCHSRACARLLGFLRTAQCGPLPDGSAAAWRLHADASGASPVQCDRPPGV